MLSELGRVNKEELQKALDKRNIQIWFLTGFSCCQSIEDVDVEDVDEVKPDIEGELK